MWWNWTKSDDRQQDDRQQGDDLALPRTEAMISGAAPGERSPVVVTPTLEHTAYVMTPRHVEDAVREHVLETGDPVFQPRELALLEEKMVACVRAGGPALVPRGSREEQRALEAERLRQIEVADAEQDLIARQVAAHAAADALNRCERPNRLRWWLAWPLVVVAGLLGTLAVGLIMAPSIDAVFFTGPVTMLLRGQRSQVAWLSTGLGLAVAHLIVVLLLLVPGMLTLVTRGGLSRGTKLGVIGVEAIISLSFALLRFTSAPDVDVRALAAAAGFEFGILLLVAVMNFALGAYLAQQEQARQALDIALADRTTKSQRQQDAERAVARGQERLLAQQLANQRHAEDWLNDRRYTELARATTRSEYLRAKAVVHGRYLTGTPLPHVAAVAVRPNLQLAAEPINEGVWDAGAAAPQPVSGAHV